MRFKAPLSAALFGLLAVPPAVASAVQLPP